MKMDNPIEQWKWRQETPRMQLAIITQAIEGWLSNLNDGTSDFLVAVTHVNTQIAQLWALRPYLERNSWLLE
jgi:hypothetical protein